MNELVGMLEKEAREIANALSGKAEWKWDDRFETVLAEFPIEMKDEVLGLLEQHLVASWDAARVSEAPAVVKKLLGGLGGLNAGQLLLLSDVNQPAFIFCAWWPWGNGMKVSVRIGPFGEDLTDDQLSSLKRDFRGWFEL